MRKAKNVERGGEVEVREEKEADWEREDGEDKGGCVRRKEDGVIEGYRMEVEREVGVG